MARKGEGRETRQEAATAFPAGERRVSGVDGESASQVFTWTCIETIVDICLALEDL